MKYKICITCFCDVTFWHFLSVLTLKWIDQQPNLICQVWRWNMQKKQNWPKCNNLTIVWQACFSNFGTHQNFTFMQLFLRFGTFSVVLLLLISSESFLVVFWCFLTLKKSKMAQPRRRRLFGYHNVITTWYEVR